MKTAKNWKEYSAQGPAHFRLEEWWKENFYKIPGYQNPSFQSWQKWYMDKYHTEWNNRHRSPEEVFDILNQEAAAATGSPKPIFFSPSEPVKRPRVEEIKTFIEDKIYSGSVKKSHPKVNIDFVTYGVKRFLKMLGDTAAELGVETPVVTSGYRGPREQARAMANNWIQHGGRNGGRRYLIDLYKDNLAEEIDDVFSAYGINRESIQMAAEILENLGGSYHMKTPAQAIDLRLTKGIKEVLDKILQSGKIRIKILFEGNHYHITVLD